ncbi:MAG: hypothetical protein HUK20_00945 [Fibrobacter sp.]|nr:hypothetical protein [Fibrobacter sp.]
MNAKVFSIVLTIVAALILVMVLVQKNGYVSQAEDNYNKKAGDYKKYGTNTTEFVSTSIGLNRQAWTVACAVAEKGVATSSDMKDLERAVGAQQGRDNNKTLVHRFELTSNYYVEALFKKVDVNKKNGLNVLTGLASLNISALQGNPVATVEEEDEEDEEEEMEEAEENPAPKKVVKAKKKAKPAPAPAKSKKRGKKR